MFDIFKPPLFHIKKLIPEHAMLEETAVEAYAHIQLKDLPEAHQQWALAWIVSVWACNSAFAGKFQLSHADFQTTYRRGMIAASWLPQHVQDRLPSIMEGLRRSGLVPYAGDAGLPAAESGRSVPVT
jgi:hypothetical protein